MEFGTSMDERVPRLRRAIGFQTGSTEESIPSEQRMRMETMLFGCPHGWLLVRESQCRAGETHNHFKPEDW